jgi:YHS domain-containing protein
LYEKRIGANSFGRLAEVGYTRKGSSFGKGGSGPECVVTGGYGTMKVEHAGKTYYVCCTGCRDLFNADPEGVLAEYRERKAQERAQ